MIINCPEKINSQLVGIIVMSHGPLASGLIESTKLITGESENLAAFGLEAGDDATNFRDTFIKKISCFPQNSVVFVDIKGGTPYNQLIVAIKQYGLNVLAISGVNLSMVVETVFARNMLSGKELLKQIEEVGKEGITNISEVVEKMFK